jgi:hypothetical protein
MRVNYTLPGFLPAEAAPPEPTRAAGDSPFRARLQFVPAPRWADWKSLLRLDQPPVNASAIGPPPRPAGLEIQDAATQRLMWRQMLDRQVVALEDHPSDLSSAAESGNRAIGRMLTLLMHFRGVEDEIATRHLAEGEG